MLLINPISISGTIKIKTITRYTLLLFLFGSCSTKYIPQKLEIGSKAPGFTATDQYGNTVSLSETIKNGPVVILFYRGQWCPVCNRHMSNVQDSLSLIDSLSASVIAITPENTENIKRTMEKSQASFSIIYDKNHKIMDDYKVTFQMGRFKSLTYKIFAHININKASENKDYALPVPATYIVNKEGTIIAGHFDENYVKRMPIKEILKVLEKD